MARIARQFAKITLFFTACVGLLGCDELAHAPAHPLPEEAVEPNTLRRAIYSSYMQLDPHFALTAADTAPIRDLFTGLMRFDAQGNIQPALAQQWFSEDGKQWLFMLDEWAKWSNNAPVTADDFVASWQRLINPQNGAKLARYLVLMGVKNAQEIQNGALPPSALGVEAVNPHTLKITLTQPYFALPKMLAHSALLPSYQGIKPVADATLVSNGAYQIKAVKPQMLYLQAVNTTPFFAAVEYQFINAKQNVDQVDLIENPPSSAKNVIQLPRYCYYFYEFNFHDPQLQQKPIRQAIQAMLAPVNLPKNLGIPTVSLLPAKMQGKNEHSWQPTTVEPLLTQAGISPKSPLKLTLTYDNQGAQPQIANAIIRALTQSDLVNVAAQPVSWQSLLQQRASQNYQLIRSGWCADHPDVSQFVSHFHSQSPDNKMGYRNEAVDSMIEQLIRKNLPEADRLQLAQRIAALLREDVAVLPLYQGVRSVAVSPSVMGIDSNNASEVIYSQDLYRIPSPETPPRIQGIK